MTAPKRTKARKALKLRVLSYNIHQGLTIHRRRITLSILREAIKSQKADLVLLQEVAGTTSESKAPRKGTTGVSTFQLEALADEIWPHYVYQKNAIFSGGFHGNAILSRYPIVQWHYLDITVAPFDKRGLLHGEIEIPDEKIVIHAMAIHLGLLQIERRRQVNRICQYIEKNIPNDQVCVLGGDFNDWRQIVSRRIHQRLGMREVHHEIHRKHAKTFPSRFPMLSLDRIYYRDLQLHSSRCLKGRPWHFLSDHLPLMADFTLPTEVQSS